MRGGSRDVAAIVRRATVADSDGILACLEEAFAPYRARYTPRAYRDTVLTPELLKKRLEGMTLFVAVEGSIIGTVAAEARPDGEGHLRGMAVVPAHQGRGVAGMLLDTALAALGEAGCTRVTIDTTAPLQRAIRFYESRGFRPTGRVAQFFGMALYEYVRPLENPGGTRGTDEVPR